VKPTDLNLSIVTAVTAKMPGQSQINGEMSKILIIYSSTDGHTLKICSRLKQTIEQFADDVTLVPVEQSGAVDLQAFDKIVIGASIRYGRHSKSIVDFIRNNLHLLESKPNAFFSVSIVARKPGKDRPETNPYMGPFLKTISWKPRKLAVFAGKLDYPKYRRIDRMIIRLIMLITGGPTDPATVVEFTNWQQVEAFAQTVRQM
jgi:menaquinone-dependent protoporphyrinogen oxidase